MESPKKQLVYGFIYTAVAKYSVVVISLIITGILSRLLPPGDFGVVAVASVIIVFFGIFTDLGIAPAIIQYKTLDDNDLSNLFSFTVWMGLVISTLFFLLAPIIGSYYDSSILVYICRLLSLNLFFNSINIIPNALFYKNKKFKFIAIRSFFVQILVGFLAVLSALKGAGIYSLLINPIISSLVFFLISIKIYPQNIRLTLGISSLRKIFNYSSYQFLFNVVNYFSRNLDKILIGKYLGMQLLGYYEKSYRLMMLPLQNITHIITPVLHPVLSDYQNDNSYLASSYEKIVRLLAFIGFPLSVFLFFTAKELILLIFGGQWLPSVPVFQILAFSVGIQIILSSSGSIFQAADDTKSLFICGVFSSILTVCGICIGIFYFKSLQAVAICISITFAINFLQSYLQMYLITFKKRKVTLFFHQLISPLFLSLLIAVSLYLLEILFSTNLLLLALIIKGSISLLISAVYIQLLGEYDIIDKIRKSI